MARNLIEEKEKIEHTKKKIELKERQLKDKQRKSEVKEYIRLGQIVQKSGISHLSENALLGSLVQIAEESKSQKNIDRWESAGAELLAIDPKTPLIISSAEYTDKELRNAIKNLNFKWNSFRNEWYGHGNLTSVQEALKAFKVTIEKVTA
jgi:hypothetical protein